MLKIKYKKRAEELSLQTIIVFIIVIIVLVILITIFTGQFGGISRFFSDILKSIMGPVDNPLK